MTYNMTLGSGSVFDVFSKIQTVAPFTEVITLALMFIAFAYFKSSNDAPTSFVGTALVGFLLSMLWYTVGLMNQMWVGGMLMLLGAAAVSYKINQSYT